MFLKNPRVIIYCMLNTFPKSDELKGIFKICITMLQVAIPFTIKSYETSNVKIEFSFLRIAINND